MRVVLADHDPAVLAASARALQGLIDCVQVTSKQDCLARLREGGYDIVIACERLADGSGLDLLATSGMSHPELLRSFAADAERLKKLGAHLTPFKLFDTISYPLDSMQLRSAMALAIAERGDLMSGEFENIVLGGDEAPDDDATHPDPVESHPQIVILTRDSTALEGAGAALADKPYRVISARDADEARADLVARQPVLALVDVGTLGMDPVNWFAEAHRASPATLLLALGRRNDGQALESLVSNGVLNRFVAKPVSHAGMRLVLDSALRLHTLNADRGNTAAPPSGLPPSPPPGLSQTPPPATRPVRPIDHEDALAGPIASLGGHKLTTVDWQPPGTGSASMGHGMRPSRPDRHPGRLPLPVALAAAASLAFGAAWFNFSRNGTPAGAPTPAAVRAPTAPATAAATPDTSAAALVPSVQTPPVPVAPDNTTDRTETTPTTDGALAADRAPAVSTTTSIAPGVTLAPPEPTLPAGAPTDTAPAPAAEPPATALEPTRPVASPPDLRPTQLPSVSFAGRTVEDSTKPVVPAPVPASRVVPPDRPPPVVMEMKLLRSAPPDYPDEARRRKVEGSVDLAFIVGSDGKVRDVQIVQSTPPGVFDAEAVSAVRRWRYDPRREDGVPVDHPAKVRLAFQLED